MQIPRFSNARYLQLSDEVLLPDKKKAKTEWVLSRKLCLYKRFDFSRLPKNKRQSALELEINRWSPFTQAQFYIVWSGHFAQVWSWDEERVLSMVKVAQVSPRHFFPETVLRLQPVKESFRIIKCLEGFELQVWHEHSLKYSRWMLKLPNDSQQQLQWQNIVRSYALQDNVIPEPLDVHLNPAPWGGQQLNLSEWGGRAEKNLLFVSLTIFFSYSLWQGVSIVSDQQLNNTIGGQLEQEIAQAEPILDARLSAIDDKIKIESLVQMLAHHSRLELVAKISKILQKEHTLTQWQYNPDQLRFRILAPGATPLYYIRQFQKIQDFKDVVAEPTRTADEIEISIQLTLEGYK